MFDPRDPYERTYWHYDSRHPLSLAQLIASGSVDAWTAALVWLLIQHRASFTVAGPTDPRPGVGKTTVLNALFQLLPSETGLVYTSGMYEDFSFTHSADSDPARTYVLCNEISDHQPFYMWGRVARRYLLLPTQGYHIATSVHADTINDVIYMYHHEFRLSSEVVRRLGLVIHVGIVGEDAMSRRRWLTTHFLRPTIDPHRSDSIIPLVISRWNEDTDTFEHANETVLDELALWADLAPQEFAAAIQRHTDYLQELSTRANIGMDAMYEAIQGRY
ncbi:MAG TPA: hypothetical protein VJ761_20345 [Ktedonobacteraceae bacterium]|nr:hypothetical protein [Ktedonobacteraceae bacterium]